MDDIAEFEILVDKEMVAGTYGPRETAIREAMNYLQQYANDGHVELYEVKRTLITVVKITSYEV